MMQSKDAFDAAFIECLEQIVDNVGADSNGVSTETLFSGIDKWTRAMFMVRFNDGADHELLRKSVSAAMTLRDLIALALDLDELHQLRAFRRRFDDARTAYQESTDRQEKRLARFAADVGLTDGKRRPKIDAFMVFIDYLRAINGVECEKLSKADALATVAEKHGIQSPEAVVSHLKRYVKDSKHKFPGILP